MEDGVKEESPEKPKCPTTAEKAGWIKKSAGGLLSLWKDRYIQLCKTHLLVFEDEDEQKCVETVELEKYDRCQDLRALLKRKNRFILIRARGQKVQDIKFQASTVEEKESWMKALNEGINRGKNKIFDEVKIDESISLQHVTRQRPKPTQTRRPPTRIHLKEVADTVSDGILRLDLDVPDSSPPDTTVGISDAANIPPPKEAPKPPMPPMKPPSIDSAPEDLEVKKPPVPPAKPIKESALLSDNMDTVKEEEDKEEEDKEEEEKEDKDDANTGDEGEEHKVVLVEEGTVEADRNTPKAPLPPPKILSNKVKVTWDGPLSEDEDVDPFPLADRNEEDSPEVAKEMLKPPTPPPKILSEQLKANMNSNQSSSELDTSDGRCQPDDLRPPVNGVDGDGMPEQDGQELLFLPKPKEASFELGINKENFGVPSKNKVPLLDPRETTRATKPRCASIGDLLSGPTDKSLLRPDLQQGAAVHVNEMEKKVACEQERTETLLQKVLQGRFEQAQEGNGPPINAETLLTEAAKQLQQATQVLQEVRELEELKKESAGLQKGGSKGLVTLYRRSAP
uniref:Pleckstrin homology domain containing O2 n=1 Tax=Salvator merianae TaxID=96440 RepID=A0A8D0KNZ1_SALMN